MSELGSVAAMIKDNLAEIEELKEHTLKLEALYESLTTTDATDREESEK